MDRHTQTRLLHIPKPTYLHAPARVLMATIFLVSGTGKLASVDATKAYMEAYGVPGYLIYPAAGFEISTGIALLAGWHTRDVGVMLAMWCLFVAGIFHRDFKDQNQQIHFMKNLAMAGGFLVLADHGESSLRDEYAVGRSSCLSGAPHWSVELRLRSENRSEDDLPSYKI